MSEQQPPYGGHQSNPAGWVPPPQYGAPVPGAPMPGYPAGPGWGPAPDPRKKFGWGGLIGAFVLGGVAAVVAGFFLLILIGLAVSDDFEDDPGSTVAWSGTSPTHPYISSEADTPKASECLEPGPGSAVLTSRSSVVDCDQSHGAEVAQVLQSPGGKERPDGDDLAAYADSACLLAFESYVGADYDDSALEFWAVVPDREAWERGDRSTWCLIDTTDGYGDDGTVKGTGQ